MSRYCKVCGIEIDPRRLAILPDTQTCTQHSTAEKKVAMVVQMGEGDHTWTETYAVDREVYDKIQETEKNFRKTTNPKPKKAKLTEEEEEELSVLDELEEETELLEDDEYIDDEDDYSADEYTEDED